MRTGASLRLSLLCNCSETF